MSVNKAINIPSLLKIGSGKISKIGKYLYDRQYFKAALFFSSGIEDVVGTELYGGLKKFGIEVVHKDSISDINIENIIHTAFKIPATVNVLIGIGGGKSLDYSKYCAHILKIPFISVPTSVSNDGFCSPNASLLVEGKRKSVKSSIPYGVVADIDVIINAPEETFYSGIGDMIAKVSALWDWKEAFNKKLSDYSDFAALLAGNSLDSLYYAEAFANFKSKEFYAKLVNSLVISGIAMEVADSSRPASGSEHLISHALDYISLSPRIHGIQTGVAAYLCARLQNNNTGNIGAFLENTGFVGFVGKAPFDKQTFIKAIEYAPKVKSDYYTILSEKDSLEKAINLIESDKILKEMIK
ncbi:MAG: iron-containing alcohol dehydrogenase family protein [Endomicrobia bacterium]|nr:iron-containing alcohol dehydrogenase family protein [Endomicrobiia bacterium]MCL2507289.1 iron-containing alcohol dehydrogenase family protein [Endomicrobiia bacterium]